MTKQCSRCKAKIPWWALSEIVNGKLLCGICLEDDEKKSDEQIIKERNAQKQKEKVVEVPNSPYSFKLIIIGLIIVSFFFYYIFISNDSSELVYQIGNSSMTLYEAKSSCEDSFARTLASKEVREICSGIPKKFMFSILAMVVGSILTLIGTIKNFIIYSKEYDKKVR